MKIDSIVSLDELFKNPDSFEFESAISIIKQRNTKLTIAETTKLLDMVKQIYLDKSEEYKGENSIFILERDFHNIMYKLNNQQIWQISEIENIETRNSVIEFLNFSSKVLVDILYQRKSKPEKAIFKIPSNHITSLKQEETALFFLTLRKLKIIHQDVSNKDLAILINGLTGYATTAMTGTLTKVYKELLKTNPEIVDNVLDFVSGLQSELSKHKLKK